jgi:hypothetical protein
VNGRLVWRPGDVEDVSEDLRVVPAGWELCLARPPGTVPVAAPCFVAVQDVLTAVGCQPDRVYRRPAVAIGLFPSCRPILPAGPIRCGTIFGARRIASPVGLPHFLVRCGLGQMRRVTDWDIIPADTFGLAAVANIAARPVDQVVGLVPWFKPVAASVSRVSRAAATGTVDCHLLSMAEHVLHRYDRGKHTVCAAEGNAALQVAT